jgi:hypothetical protein
MKARAGHSPQEKNDLPQLSISALLSKERVPGLHSCVLACGSEPTYPEATMALWPSFLQTLPFLATRVGRLTVGRFQILLGSRTPRVKPFGCGRRDALT